MKCRAAGWEPEAGRSPWEGWGNHREGLACRRAGARWFPRRWGRRKWRAGSSGLATPPRERLPCGEEWSEPEPSGVALQRVPSESVVRRARVASQAGPSGRWRKERRVVRRPLSKSLERFPSSGARSMFVWTGMVVDFRFRSCARGVLTLNDGSKTSCPASVKPPTWDFSIWWQVTDHQWDPVEISAAFRVETQVP